jgi:hypothetical protein
MEETLAREGHSILRGILWGFAIFCYACTFKAGVLWATTSADAATFWAIFAGVSAVIAVVSTIVATRMRRSPGAKPANEGA